ncbi:lytic transglycosylase domain-containing protein [Ralstonia solanacearum]|uniref:lytic transglycosylase domain-containing protein n=1 Tax=Ralstonia solanacearum TaxID=305 RepID=UPI0005028983|nr:lytic transglycosylase domain-containing protein [Ralstonia solanacearum]KFX78554.1 lytic transglycosylase [Ralstonia solanacearum]OCQ67815.1 lytic transglycosylase [Ralstonia solanacearum]
MVDFYTLAQQCAPGVHPTTLQAVVRTESGYNPYAIGVVGGRLARQPKSRAEAVATAKALHAQGLNFSMGLGQVNKAHLARFSLNYESVFDACANLQAGARILQECYQRAVARLGADQALSAAISCYYSGSFRRGFQVERGGTSYVQRVAANATTANPVLDVVPAIPVVMDRPPARAPNAAAPTRPAPPADGAVRHSPSATAQVERVKARAKWDAFGDFRPQ